MRQVSSLRSGPVSDEQTTDVNVVVICAEGSSGSGRHGELCQSC